MRSKIDELIRLVHPRDGHPKILAMIDAYLDESGIHDGSKVCAIAGYFGGSGQFRKFNRAWKAVLDEFDIPLEEFHAKDLLNRKRLFRKLEDSVWCDLLEAIS